MLSFKEKMSLRSDPKSKYYVEDLNYPMGIFGKIAEENFEIHSNSRNIQIIKDMKLRKDDVIICGLPKSGIFSI